MLIEQNASLTKNGRMAEEKQSKKRQRIGFLTDDEFANEIRRCVFTHRLTLEEFFTSAARREMARLGAEPTPQTQGEVVKLPRGRPIRPKESDE